MQSRTLGGQPVSEIGLGCMSLSHAYSVPPIRERAMTVVRRAIELGVSHLDTAALYGFGANEELLGEILPEFRSRIHLASKCGMTGVDGRRVIDGRPETLRRTLDESLRRCRTDVIDLYYLHRLDRSVPLEDSIGALAQMVEVGKIRSIGLSEVSVETLRRAHALHPVAAVQSEYSLWTREPELGVLEECRRSGIAFVAFSPLGRRQRDRSVPVAGARSAPIDAAVPGTALDAEPGAAGAVEDPGGGDRPRTRAARPRMVAAQGAPHHPHTGYDIDRAPRAEHRRRGGPAG
jgi:aryl-alcohol dehydrogenase-like predicted oxidoreductase